MRLASIISLFEQGMGEKEMAKTKAQQSADRASTTNHVYLTLIRVVSPRLAVFITLRVCVAVVD